MAQGRGFSGQNRVAGDHSHDFWGDSDLSHRNREAIWEVGGAGLFEAPRSGVRKVPRFLDPMGRTSDDDFCDDNAHSDSGAHYSDDALCKPKKADDDQCDSNAQCDDGVCYTSYTDDARYEPNTSRRRRSCSQQRRPCASRAETVRSHTESIRPVRKPKKDWKELWGLGCDLIFEALRLVLLVSVTIVRIGAVLTESIGRWLDKGMPKALGLGHKEDWIGTKDQRSYEEDTHKKKDHHHYEEDWNQDEDHNQEEAHCKKD